MKKFALGIVLAVSIFFGARDASAMRCTFYNPIGGQCTAWQPDYPPGGRDCTGAPHAGEVNIYSGPNKSGWCVTLPSNMGWWNLTSANGWYGYFYVKDIEVASGVTNGWVCSYQNGYNPCYLLSSPYNYSYNNPPYTASQPGWQSIYVGP